MQTEVLEHPYNYDLKTVCYPFVKWAGGKGQIIPQISQLIPAKFTRYIEPFLGGGAVYFYLSSCRNLDFAAFLSDTNIELMNVYVAIRDHAEELIKILRYHQHEYRKSPSKYFYKLRDRIRLDDLERAARFITLNKTCYNGLYRVNRNGHFNVPVGRYKNPLICDDKNIRNVSRLLRNSRTHIKSTDYEDAVMRSARSDDFVYLDPPYNPVSSTANFTGYTNNGFSTEDQYQLAKAFKKLDKRGCKLLLSNSSTPIIRELYKDYSIVEVQANRAINSKASKRVGHTELLIRNFN
jgi:DNA adenine methylase